MKRIGNIFNRIIDFNNLVLADKKARLNKSKRYGIAKFDKHSHENLLKLQRMFIEGTYLELEVKHDWQIYPVDDRGVDFLGYVFKHSHMKLRKDMKKKFYRKTRYVNLNKKFRSLASYWGWCKYGNCFNLWKRFTGTNSIKELKILLLGYDKNCT